MAETGVRMVSDALDFQDWTMQFRAVAERQGISATTLEQAFRGVQFLPDVIEKDRHQSEFTKQIWEYLDSAVSGDRVRNGRVALARNAALLEAIEDKFGVDKEVVAAIWGVESAYGAVRGDVPVISALATLAFEGRRRGFFEQQLIAALRIVQAGNVRPDAMTGSWAGAIGHTQFIPTSFLDCAVDFNGDGRPDVWSDDPGDALASTAAYLAGFGWRKGQPWGVEVTLPHGFDYGQSGERIHKPVEKWMAAGVRAADGSRVPAHGPASILLPAGAQGVPLMIFENFHVLERYNLADAYVIGVGHLADRIAGRPEFRAGWPREDRPLAVTEKCDLQERLTAAGFNTFGVDGVIGPNTIAAVRAYQASLGQVADGYASSVVLDQLR